MQVNSKLQTSNPDVYAVGDVAAFPLTKYGITTRQEHVANARGSASLAVSHILSPSDTPDYYYLPFFYSRIFNLSWQVRPVPTLPILMSKCVLQSSVIFKHEFCRAMLQHKLQGKPM